MCSIPKRILNNCTKSTEGGIQQPIREQLLAPAVQNLNDAIGALLDSVLLGAPASRFWAFPVRNGAWTSFFGSTTYLHILEVTASRYTLLTRVSAERVVLALEVTSDLSLLT